MPYIVYIRRLNANTFLHVYGENDQAFRLRDYSFGPNVAARQVLRNTPDYGYDDVLREAHLEGNHICERPGNIAVTNTTYWHAFIQQANQQYGIGPPVPGPPVPGPPVPGPPVPGPNQGRVVPRTSMRHLYHILEDFTAKECHLALAVEAARVPLRLAKRFAESVEYFSKYENANEPFVPPNAPRRDLPAWNQINQITATTELTSLLVGQCQGVGNVENDPSLSFRFLEREVIPSRTTGNAVYDDGSSAQRGPQLDWLLVNRHDRTPIIAEIKVREDKDAFYALIQSLMYAAELSTPAQRQRLAQHYPGCEVDSIDIYLVLSGFNENSKIQREILDKTRSLCESLVRLEEVAAFVRRLSCLEGSLSQVGRLSFNCRYRFERQ